MLWVAIGRASGGYPATTAVRGSCVHTAGETRRVSVNEIMTLQQRWGGDGFCIRLDLAGSLWPIWTGNEAKERLGCAGKQRGYDPWDPWERGGSMQARR